MAGHCRDLRCNGSCAFGNDHTDREAISLNPEYIKQAGHLQQPESVAWGPSLHPARDSVCCLNCAKPCSGENTGHVEVMEVVDRVPGSEESRVPDYCIGVQSAHPRHSMFPELPSK